MSMATTLGGVSTALMGFTAEEVDPGDGLPRLLPSDVGRRYMVHCPESCGKSLKRPVPTRVSLQLAMWWLNFALDTSFSHTRNLNC